MFVFKFLERLIRREFKIRKAKKGFKSKCAAVAILRHLTGKVEKLTDESRFGKHPCRTCIDMNGKGADPSNYLHAGPRCGLYHLNEECVFVHLVFEGLPKDIKLCLGDLNSEKDIEIEELECNKNKLEYAAFVILETDVSIKGVNSSGGKRGGFSLRSDSTTSIETGFKEALLLRDKRVCRMHGKDCPFVEFGNDDTYAAGHISSVGKNEQIAKVADMGLTHDVRNGYLWCHESEFCWSKYLFTINSETGYVEFASNFPFEDMRLEKGVKIQIGKWSENDESKNEEFECEPPKWLIEERNKIYNEKREELLSAQESKGIKQEFECACCGKWFKGENDLEMHRSVDAANFNHACTKGNDYFVNNQTKNKTKTY